MGASRLNRPAPKPLWSGTWSAGQTKTVAGLSEYAVFACSTGGLTMIPAIMPPGGTVLRFFGGYGNETPNQFLYTATFTRSGDSLTLLACHESNVHGSTKTASTVTLIYGIC